MQEINFDKFINDICQREQDATKRLQEYGAGQEEHPQRRYNKLYRELPQNRIVYRGDK